MDIVPRYVSCGVCHHKKQKIQAPRPAYGLEDSLNALHHLVNNLPLGPFLSPAPIELCIVADLSHSGH